MRAKFVTIEGIDGAGKSSHLPLIQSLMEVHCGRPVQVTREPGGTPLGEKLRELMIHEKMEPRTEALIMAASRHEHIQKVIKPCLDAGQWVLSDRFTLSSRAYQEAGRNIRDLDQLIQWSTHGLEPDLILLFDVPPKLAKNRIGDRKEDKFEREDNEFFTTVRNAYLYLAEHSTNVKVIDASHPIEKVTGDVSKTMLEWLSGV